MSNDKNRLPAEARSACEGVSRNAEKGAARPLWRARAAVFALDATASREPSWDRACGSSEMFEATAASEGWKSSSSSIAGSRNEGEPLDEHRRRFAPRHALGVCVGGETQIERVLAAHPRNQEPSVRALVFVGDAMEKNIDRLCHLAGELGNGVPIFCFRKATPERRQRPSTDGAAVRGERPAGSMASADRLKGPLGAVAVYAAGGYRALTAYGERAERCWADCAIARVTGGDAAYLLEGFFSAGSCCWLSIRQCRSGPHLGALGPRPPPPPPPPAGRAPRWRRPSCA